MHILIQWLVFHYLQKLSKIIKKRHKSKKKALILYQSYSLQMAGAAGIEPAITVLETVAIPFNYAPKKVRFYII